ncbi:TVP38/TMEM64 family protein [Paenibacillus sp. CECT 9249]|uniref:TVP38/TMEM64 family protein n=1 Tax=unclassified Paenibacillus TaxID=185978 RepID=UPI001C0FECD5|nr:VTT domain-containing protein [Paenibacillus sp. CECT 9249]MBU5442952.1 VTT domain-containing protein [Paenibacillus sp. MSJ-34]CAH0119500.1 hypothetical protein PAE9249_02004 [Paenibacillus sp. CECT 9249]
MIAINKKAKLISFAFLVILFIAALTTEPFSLLLRGDLEKFRELTNENMALVLLLTLTLMIVQNLVTIIPVIVLISLNVTMFGFIYGYLWSYLSSIVAATIAFFAARYWFQEFLSRKLNQKWKNKIEGRGYVYILICRLLPFMPSSIINTAAGISGMKFGHFTISTVIGNFIYFSALALVSLGIMSIEFNGYTYASMIGVAALGAAAVYAIRRKRKARTQEEGSETNGM